MKSFFLILLLIIAAFLGTSTYAHISNTLGKEVPLKTGDSKDKEYYAYFHSSLYSSFHWKQPITDYIDIDNVVIDLQEFGVGEYQLVLSLNTTMLY